MNKLSSTPPHPVGYRAQSKRNKELFTTFFQRFVGSIGYHAVRDPEQPIVYWIDSRDKLNNLQVRYYARPFQAGKDTPWVVRLHINHYSVEIPPKCLRSLLGDFPRQRGLFPAENQGWQMELSILPDQLSDTIDWVVQLVHSKDGGRFDPSAVPPFPCDWDGEYQHDSQYGWSVEAWHIYDAWTKRERMRRSA